MSAAYLDPRVTLDAATREVHAEFEIRNESSETWRAAEGFGIGYHLFDADTGTLIIDGARTHPERDLKPGESARVRMAFDVPEESGQYQVLISPMREGVCWYYEQGWPVLLVEAESRGGAVALAPVRQTTAAALRRRRELRAVGRAVVYPFRTIWRNRSLIRVMVRRDILGRYRGSFGGSFWTVMNPLLLILTYFFVFGLVLGQEVPGDPGRFGFARYLLAGMLPWLAFTEGAARAPSVVLEHRNFVKKLVFAVETLPFNLVVSGLVSEFFAVILYCGFLVASGRGVPVTVFWLPVLLIPQVMFTAGVSWFLAALGAFVKDLGQFIGFLLTIWFFLTPICYPEAKMRAMAPFLSKNPIFILVRGYRSILLEHHAPAFGSLWKLWLLSLIVFVLGHAWFYKLRKSFADMI
ncbi:ABC-2 type transporter [Candidatus Sulfopaludibacter sp. SbA3]|nr:ABC-2 type transporter [Candidatus Sulfopaludibacter sp. SbA3]